MFWRNFEMIISAVLFLFLSVGVVLLYGRFISMFWFAALVLVVVFVYFVFGLIYRKRK